LTTLSGKKFGTANKHTMNAVSRIAAAFHFEMYSMDSPGSELACSELACFDLALLLAWL
jgi:hypothetical protein